MMGHGSRRGRVAAMSKGRFHMLNPRVIVLVSGAALCSAALAQPANDDCSSAEAVSGYGAFAFDSTGATTDGPGTSCGSGTANNDIWFSWTATETGSVKFSLCGAVSHDSVMAAYSGPCVDLSEIACNDDTCFLDSEINFSAVAGETYLIRIGGYSDGDTSSGTLTASPYIPGVVIGPVVSPINGHTYYLLEPSSWTDGEANAQALGGHLATVRSADENNWIYSTLLRPNGEFRRGWLGLNDIENEGTFVWTSGEPVTFTNWGGGEPNNSGNVEHYTQMPWWAPEWNDNSDLPTDDESYPIVEIIPNTCPADFNGDGFPDGFDYDDYVACFEGEACPPGKNADFTNDGFVDGFDYDGFVEAFENGCD